MIEKLIEELFQNFWVKIVGIVPFTLLAFHTLNPVVALVFSGYVAVMVHCMAEVKD